LLQNILFVIYKSSIIGDCSKALSTLETVVADFGDNLSPNSATVAAVLATVASVDRL